MRTDGFRHERLHRLRHEDASTYYHRRQAYVEQDALDQAFADLSEAIRLNPDHADAHCARADCLRCMGEYDRAITEYDASVLLNPVTPHGYRFRADAHVDTENYDLAVADCNTTLQLSPRNPTAHLTRGNAHLHNGV